MDGLEIKGLRNLDNCPNLATFEAAFKCERHLITHHNILVSISGGSDSDVMLDFYLKILQNHSCKDRIVSHYVFFDTGIEYHATRRHLDYLEEKYGIEIERAKAKVPVPLGCNKYGVPFLSKFVSQMIERLQRHDFDFSKDGEKSFEELIVLYPKCRGALTWWCNRYPAQKGKRSHFNINNNRLLKEFMIVNPPTFRISAKCCNGAKKDTSHDYEESRNIDLKLLGIRKAEGGIRASAYKSCFDDNAATDRIDQYRPIFWFTDKDKETYEKRFGVKHSDCYEVYGMKRTGCAGCPFNSKFEKDLKVIEIYEPKLYKAITNIFGKSYDYLRACRKYKNENKERNKPSDIGRFSFTQVEE